MDTETSHPEGLPPKCPPVLFLIFNRPDMSRRVFNRIREAHPGQLFIAADGPRPNRSEEAQLCKKTRQLILDQIDWPCEVKTLFREKNLGCKRAVSSAIDWFFEQVEEGIIFEDDCQPSPSFFQFCNDLLHQYRNDEQIMMISGNCHLPRRHRPDTSYYFSEFTYIWGWATWKRAWKHMDVSLENQKTVRLPTHTSSRKRTWWEQTFDLNKGKGSSWAFPWQFSCWNQSGLSINPSRNLVSHIDTMGTHMKPYDPLVNLPAENINFPLIPPTPITPNKQLDQLTERLMRRSVPTNLRLIALYLICLPFNKQLPLKEGISQLTSSLVAEIRSRKN